MYAPSKGVGYTVVDDDRYQREYPFLEKLNLDNLKFVVRDVRIR